MTRCCEAYDAVQQQMIADRRVLAAVSTSRRRFTRPCGSSIPKAARRSARGRFDVQLIGGLVLYEGKIAEMATGEGKTFVAPLACFMQRSGRVPLSCRDGERLPGPPRCELDSPGV